MKLCVLLLSYLLTVKISAAQKLQIIYKNPADKTFNFYELRVPQKAIRGLLVLNARRLSDSVNTKAANLGICVLTVVPTANNLDNLASDSILISIDRMIGEVIRTHKIPTDKIIIGGMSVAGTGAVRYAGFCSLYRSAFGIKPCGVFGVDPPLDYERLYREATKAISRNFSQDAVEESKTLVELLSRNMKGTPQTNPDAYQKMAPFCYSANDGGNAFLLNKLAVRLYTEPDINWWIDNRRKDYYDLNSIDDAALINQLKLNGNTKAELIVTNNKGVKIDKHPHSWSIVDEAELLQWCGKLFAE